MNGTEQRERHTAVTAIAARQGNVETVVEALAGEIVKDRAAHTAALTTAIAAERARRQEVLALHRTSVDTVHAALASEFHAFRDRAFWGRLRWLVIGS